MVIVCMQISRVLTICYSQFALFVACTGKCLHPSVGTMPIVRMFASVIMHNGWGFNQSQVFYEVVALQ